MPIAAQGWGAAQQRSRAAGGGFPSSGFGAGALNYTPKYRSNPWASATPRASAPAFGGFGGPAPFDYNALYNAFNAQQGAQYAGLGNQDQNLRARLGLTGQQYGVQQQQAQLGYDERLFDLNQARGQNIIDLAAAYRLSPYYDQLMDMARANFGSQMAGFGFQESNTRVSSAQEKANYRSDVASRGANYAPGTQQQLGTIASLLSGNLGQIGEQRKQAYIGLGEKLTGLEEQKKQGIDQQKKLQMVADSFGQRADFLKRDLTLGLKSLGISHQMSVNDIMTALTSNDIKRKELGFQAMVMAQQAAAAQRGAYG